MNPTVNYSTLLDNRVKDIFGVVSPTVKDEYSMYSTKISDKQQLHTLSGVTGLSMGEIIADGQVPTSDAPIQGFTKTYTQQIFSKRIRLSKASMYYLFENGEEAKIKAKIESEITDVKNSIVHCKNYLAQSMLYGANATSFTFTPLGGLGNTVSVDTTGIDGVAAFSASHPREDGGTSWSNIVVAGATTDPSFSLTSLLAARALHAQKKDGRGLPLVNSSLDKLLCQMNSQTYFLATTIKNTLASGRYPSTSLVPSNSTTGVVTLGTPTSLVDANPTESFDIMPLMVYGGTGITSIFWAMYDSKMINAQHGLLYIESMPTQLITAEDVLGGLDYVKTAIEYCTFGFGDMRPFEWSNGTGI